MAILPGFFRMLRRTLFAFGVFFYAANFASAATCSSTQIYYLGSCIDEVFKMGISATNGFEFEISAKGTFYVDWGDGDVERFINKDTTTVKKTHKYSTSARHVVRLAGSGTEASMDNPAIRFSTDWRCSSTCSSANAEKITGVSGSLGALFPADANFNGTFTGAKNLTSVPSTLFSGSTTGVDSKFEYTFAYSGLTSIPVGLFPTMSTCGAYMFQQTFYHSDLATIPSGFSFNNTNYCESMYNSTFSYTKIKTIPATLFKSSSCDTSMFEETFAHSTLESIPANLFSTLDKWSDCESLFNGTFRGTNISSVPAGLFSGFHNSEDYMWAYTFSECSNLTSLPENMFENLGEWANSAFEETFSYTGLTALPKIMFPNMDDSPTGSSIFWGMFKDCTDLTGYIPYTLFSTVWQGYDYEDFMDSIFENTNLWTSCSSHNMEQYKTGFEDAWNGHVSCVDTTAGALYVAYENTDEVEIEIGAGGNFVIDWGDGQKTTISNKSVEPNRYAHNYNVSGNYLVKLSGRATGYLTTSSDHWRGHCEGGSHADISFGGSCDDVHDYGEHIVAVYGKISNVFPNVSGRPPRMAGLFAGASKLTEIPSDLFSGLTGCTESQYEDAFWNSGLTEIPSNLFSGANCTAKMMFTDAFGWTKIKTIPEGLFSNLSGIPKEQMFSQTFYDCDELTSVPANLFGRLSGSPEWYAFYRTFEDDTNLRYFTATNCMSVTYVPSVLFGNITFPSDMNYAFDSMFYDSGVDRVCPSGTTFVVEIPGESSHSVCSWSCTSTLITCDAGKYLPKNATSCSVCPAGKYCTGGTYSYSTTADQGITGTLSAAYYSNGGAKANNGTCLSGYTCGTCNSNYRANTAVGKTSVSQCQTSCAAGTRVVSARTACATPNGSWYSLTHTVNYGSTSGTNVKSCSTGYSTPNTTVKTDHDSASDCVGNTYTISFDLNGGGTRDSITATYGVAYDIVPPTRTGYTFDGWVVSGMDSTTHYFGTQANPELYNSAATTLGEEDGYHYSSRYWKNLRATSGTVTFKAFWKANTYTVSFNANGGSGAPSKSSVVCTYGQNCPAFATRGTLSKTGYIFNDWNTNAAGTGTNYYEGTTTANNLSATNNATVVLYANWVPIYKITFNKNGGINGLNILYINGVYGTPCYESDCSDGQDLQDLWVGYEGIDVPTKTGYAFSGYKNPNGNFMINSSGYFINPDTQTYLERLDSDETWNAQWSGNDIDIDYDLNGGTGNISDDSKMCTYGEAFTLPDAPTKKGYVFTGWELQ